MKEIMDAIVRAKMNGERSKAASSSARYECREHNLHTDSAYEFGKHLRTLPHTYTNEEIENTNVTSKAASVILSYSSSYDKAKVIADFIRSNGKIR